MRFRPCIDIHNGCVKQIVGSSLCDEGNFARENFVSKQGADFYARLYKQKGLFGGHIILLNKKDSEFYEMDKQQAFAATKSFAGGMQVGGGVTAENAAEFLENGASHVIVTSYVFSGGKISFERLDALKREVGREKIVLDLSCRKKDGSYYIVTDRWQKFTDTVFNAQSLEMLSSYCDEFLVHAVDAEGKAGGIEAEPAAILGQFEKNTSTYAGGIRSFDDIALLKKLGRGKVDFTVGSALDIFGGSLEFEKVSEFS